MKKKIRSVVLLLVVALAIRPSKVSGSDISGAESGYHAHGGPYEHEDEGDVKSYLNLYPEPEPSTGAPKGDDGSATTGQPKGGFKTPAAQGRSLLATIATYLPLLLSPRDEHSSIPSGLNIPDLLRMVGIDSNRIGTMVINVVVYLVEMVSNHFFGVSNTIESRKIDSPSSLLFYLFDTKRAENFMRTITNPNYPNSIISNLKRQTGNDTVCIQQLICKMSPFWWGVNRSVRDLLPVALGKAGSKMPNVSLKGMLLKYVPSIKEFTSNSDECDLQYPGCVVVALGQQRNKNHNNNVN